MVDDEVHENIDLLEKLIEKWTPEHRKQFAERCREYEQTYKQFAETIEETL